MSPEDASTVAGGVLIPLEIIAVGCRFYTRWFTKVGFRWDDWMILISMCVSIVPGALTIWAGSVSSTGPDAASNFNPDYVFTEADILYTKITFATSVLYYSITSFTKMSILLLFHRLFGVRGSFKFQLYACMAAVTGFWISTTLANVLNCIPLKWTWLDGESNPKYCFNYNTFWLWSGIVEAIIDLAILILPFSVIYGLHLSRGKKLGVLGVFLVGALVLCSGIAKVVLSYVPNNRQPHFSAAALWTTVHTYTGIILANLPPSWPLLHKGANLIPASWSTLSQWTMLSTVRRRWYSLSGTQPTRDGSAGRRSTGEHATGDYERAEAGMVDYELPKYGPAGHATDQWTGKDASQVHGTEFPK